MEGDANQWWQWLDRAYTTSRLTMTWLRFCEKLWARFGPFDNVSCHEALAKIEQTGSLSDYLLTFEKLGNRCFGWTEEALVGSFMGGLKYEISDAIRMFKPETMREAIRLAKVKTAELEKHRGVQRNPARGPLEAAVEPPPPPSRVAPPRNPNARRMSPEEVARRRAQ
ncbi:unnamed protein product [Linum trigynum]|uniref:Retrotransposon gag domain-containing protein n=1 Tax=Linum trigynum TaxID=586398 RepID=A0AAV2GT08_9ROSI